MLCRRHLNMGLNRDGALKYPRGDKALDELLGDGWSRASGVRTRQVGNGMVVFMASDEWPAASIRSQYEECLKSLAEEAVGREKERGWFESNEDVEFACYEQPDGSRVFYLLNIRWWDHKPSQAVYRLGKRKETITVPFGEIIEFRG